MPAYSTSGCYLTVPCPSAALKAASICYPGYDWLHWAPNLSCWPYESAFPFVMHLGATKGGLCSLAYLRDAELITAIATAHASY